MEEQEAVATETERKAHLGFRDLAVDAAYAVLKNAYRTYASTPTRGSRENFLAIVIIAFADALANCEWEEEEEAPFSQDKFCQLLLKAARMAWRTSAEGRF